MAVDFAMPIAHQETTNYSAFNNALQLGRRRYRQAFATVQPDANDFTDGLELFFANATVAGIYAVFNGALRCQPATATEPLRLILDTNKDVLLHTRDTTALSSLLMLESPPVRFAYENVDSAAVQTALETLLTTEYTRATTGRPEPARRNWHPALQMEVMSGNRRRRLRDHLRGTGRRGDVAAWRAGEITRLVREFLAGTGTGTMLTIIQVRSGEKLGEAAPYLATDRLPATPAFSMGSARRLTWRTYDVADQTVDPAYYLHVFTGQALLPANQRIVNSCTTILNVTDASTRTTVLARSTLAHPLVTLLPALAQVAAPRGRAQLSGVTRIPMGTMVDFHAFPTANPVSKLKWRYVDTGMFEAAKRLDTITVIVPPLNRDPNITTDAPHATRQENTVKAVWTTYGRNIALLSETFQVPCELILALIATESVGRERVIRLEPLTADERTALLRPPAPAASLELAYDKAASWHGTVSDVVDNPDGTTTLNFTCDEQPLFGEEALSRRGRMLYWGTSKSLILWNSERTAVTRPARNRYTLKIRGARRTATEAWLMDGWGGTAPETWNGSAAVQAGSTLTYDQLVTVIDACLVRVSPGMLQTLTNTALAASPWVRAMTPASVLTELGLSNVPTTSGGYVRWLLNANASLLMGTAYMRLGYNALVAPTSRFDLPLVGAAYNRGFPERSRNTLWGLTYYGNYVEGHTPRYDGAGAHFNVATRLFSANALTPAATVRLMK